MSLVVCHTDGCSSRGQGIDIDTSCVDENGAPCQVDAVFCGACGQQITDITG